MKRPVFFLPLLLAAALLVACDDDEAGSTSSPTSTATSVATAPVTPEVTNTPAATPTATAAASDGPRRTGDAAIDAIIEAVEKRDMGALAGLVAYTEVGCTHADGLGGPPKCLEGQEEGEVQRVFPSSACEGEWTRTPVTTLGQFVERARGAWAALEVTEYDLPGAEWPTPDAFLVFHSSGLGGDDIAIYLEVTGGQITRSAMVCAGDLDDLLATDVYAFEVIGGPWDEPQPPSSVEPPSIGVAGVDAVLEQVARYDWVGLRDNARETMQTGATVACEAQVEGPGGLECDPKNDEQPGDEVHVFPMAFCEGALTRDPAQAMQGFLNSAPRLHSVLRAPSEPSPSELYRHGDYWLVYEFTAPRGEGFGIEEGARLHVLEDGGIAVLWYGCAPPLEELTQYDGEPLDVVLDARE